MTEDNSSCQICNGDDYKNMSFLRFKQDKEDFCFKCNLISFRFKGILDTLLYGILSLIAFDLYNVKYFESEYNISSEIFFLILSGFWLLLFIYSLVLTVFGFYFCLKNKELKKRVFEKEKVCYDCSKNFDKIWWGFFVFFGWKSDRCLSCTLLINRYYTSIISIIIVIFSIFYLPYILDWDFPYNLKMIIFLAIISISSAIQAFSGIYLRIKIR